MNVHQTVIRRPIPGTEFPGTIKEATTFHEGGALRSKWHGDENTGVPIDFFYKSPRGWIELYLVLDKTTGLVAEWQLLIAGIGIIIKSPFILFIRRIWKLC